MLKTRKRWISLLVTLTFLLSLVPMGAALGADNATYANTCRTNLSRDNEIGQAIGWIKITDIPACEYVYITVELPDKVDFDEVPANASAVRYSSDGTVGAEVGGNLVTADEDTLVAWVDVRNNDGGYIKILFNDAYGTDVLLKSGCASDVVVTLTVKGIESGSTLWKDENKTFKLATIGNRTVTITADSPKTIKAGEDGQKIADITIKESNAATLDGGDELILSLPDGFEWDLPSDPFDSGDTDWSDWVDNGPYGLTVDRLSTNEDGDLVVHFGGASSMFADEVTLSLQVKVFPDADEGNVEVDVTENFDSDGADIDWSDVSLVVATVGETDVTVSVDDTSDDNIYPGSFNVAIDDITIEGSSNFEADSTVTLTLPKGFVWYIDDANNGDVLDYAEIEAYDGISEVVGTYNDDRSLWIRLSGDTDEVTFEDFTIAALPDAPLGDITVTLGGTAGAKGTVVVGTCIAAANISADKPSIKLASMDQAAGKITLVEAKKDAFDSADEEIILDLPTGVSFADDDLTVEINGNDVDVTVTDTFGGTDHDMNALQITGFSVSDNKIETIVISGIEYDLDSRVGAGDIKVAIGGALVNRLDDASNDVVDDIRDYADDTIYSVANATAVSATAAEAVLTIGSTTMTVNGKEVTMDVAPYLKDGRTFLPVRFAANAVGVSDANIIWDGANQRVTILKGDRIVQMTIGEKTLLLNGASIPMDVAPEVVPPGRTMLPIRFLAMALGADIAWNPDTQTVTIKVE